MRIVVCGGRDFADQGFLNQTLNQLAKDHQIDAIIEGNSRGADRLAGFWARKRGIDNLKYPPNWDRYGLAAGPMRNQEMIDNGKPDLVVAFPGGKGTADMVERARLAGIPVWEPCGARVKDTLASR